MLHTKMDQQGTCTNPGLQQSGQPTPTSKGHLNFMCIKKSHVQTCHLLKDGNETWRPHQGPLQVNRAMNMVIHVVKPAINMPFGVF